MTLNMTMSNGVALNAALEKSADLQNNGCNGTLDSVYTAHTSQPRISALLAARSVGGQQLRGYSRCVLFALSAVLSIIPQSLSV